MKFTIKSVALAKELNDEKITILVGEETIYSESSSGKMIQVDKEVTNEN
jgi:hypothetical protein